MMNPIRRNRPSVSGRLKSRPETPTEVGRSGLQPLNVGSRRDGWLYVPPSYCADRASSLLLMLHGAGGDAEGGLRLIRPYVEGSSMLVLAVDSREQTWDVMISHYGSDSMFIDRALSQTFARYSINPTRVAIAGFSDGGSYALSLGLTNGDLFSHIIAFSPGFMAPADFVGNPRCFISHGTGDRVLPIELCSRRIVPQLRQANYDVIYREFHGGHSVPAAIARDSLTWFTD